MEKESQDQYEVVFTPTAQRHFFHVINFFYQRHDATRAEQLSDELHAQALSLAVMPYRGAMEPLLAKRKYEYRFLLFKRTDQAEIKIIYFVDKQKRVIVTDFIGTEEFPTKIEKRNS